MEEMNLNRLLLAALLVLHTQTVMAEAQTGAVQHSNSKAATASPQPAAPELHSGVLSPQQMATTGEVLQIAKISLDEAHAATTRSLEQLKFFASIGTGGITLIVGLFAFLGYREVKSLTKPVRDTLEVQSKALADAKTALDEAKEGHLRSIEAIKREHQEAMAGLIADFVKQSQLNSTAQVIAATIWEYVNQDTPDKGELSEVVRLVKSVIKEGEPSNLDPLLEGVLLIRMAYAQKRLGDPHGAFESAKRAIELNGNVAKHFWLYNTACYAALAGQHEECCMYIKLAIDTDAQAREKFTEDADLEAVREEAWYKEIFA